MKKDKKKEGGHFPNTKQLRPYAFNMFPQMLILSVSAPTGPDRVWLFTRDRLGVGVAGWH